MPGSTAYNYLNLATAWPLCKPQYRLYDEAYRPVHLSYHGRTLLYAVHSDPLSYRGCTLSGRHGVLSSVPKQTRSVHQAEAVIALAGDFNLFYYCTEWIIIADVSTYSGKLELWWYISHRINLFD